MDTIKCPVCNKDLKTITYQNQEVDVCQACGGVWFDKGELLKVVDGLLSKDLVDPESVKEAYGKKAVSSEDIDKFQRCCPRCKVGFEVFNFSYDSNVFLDRCPSCSGIWADKGEWRAIAKYKKGNPEVDKLAETMASELKKTSRLYILSSKKAKVVAVLIAVSYLVSASIFIGLKGFLVMLLRIVLPIVCIFFGENIGDLTGIRYPFALYIVVTKPTPGFIVVLGGWLLLLLPLFTYIATIFAEM